MVKLKRIYEEYSKEDGFRVLVDRIWPRGVSKEKAHINLWMKEIGPSDELREWFNHDPEKWEEFRKKYKGELKGNTEPVSKLKKLALAHKTLTVLYGAKDTEHNQAVVLREFLKE